MHILYKVNNNKTKLCMFTYIDFCIRGFPVSNLSILIVYRLFCSYCSTYKHDCNSLMRCYMCWLVISHRSWRFEVFERFLNWTPMKNALVMRDQLNIYVVFIFVKLEIKSPCHMVHSKDYDDWIYSKIRGRQWQEVLLLMKYNAHSKITRRGRWFWSIKKDILKGTKKEGR